MTKLIRLLPYLVIALALAGLLDSVYLTYEHYSGIIPPCSIHWWLTDCGKVLRSQYSVLFGLIPLAVLGILQYSVELVLSYFVAIKQNILAQKLLLLFSTMGLLSSAYFVYLMIFVIHAICLYCFGSAIISLLIFIVVVSIYPQKTIPVIK